MGSVHGWEVAPVQPWQLDKSTVRAVVGSLTPFFVTKRVHVMVRVVTWFCCATADTQPVPHGDHWPWLQVKA
jgi:hypothetical protein